MAIAHTYKIKYFHLSFRPVKQKDHPETGISQIIAVMEESYLDYGPIAVFIVFILCLAPLVIWFWALLDAIQNDFQDANNKIIWILLILFLPIIGSICYLFIGQRHKI